MSAHLARIHFRYPRRASFQRIFISLALQSSLKYVKANKTKRRDGKIRVTTHNGSLENQSWCFSTFFSLFWAKFLNESFCWNVFMKHIGVTGSTSLVELMCFWKTHNRVLCCQVKLTFHISNWLHWVARNNPREMSLRCLSIFRLSSLIYTFPWKLKAYCPFTCTTRKPKQEGAQLSTKTNYFTASWTYLAAFHFGDQMHVASSPYQ